MAASPNQPPKLTPRTFSFHKSNLRDDWRLMGEATVEEARSAAAVMAELNNIMVDVVQSIGVVSVLREKRLLPFDEC